MTPLTKFRKTALVEAVQYRDQMRVDDCLPDGVFIVPMGDNEDAAVIHTLEGSLRVSDGDWVLTGINGEHWPVRDDIFKATYELAPLPPRSPEGETQEINSLIESAHDSESHRLVTEAENARLRQSIERLEGEKAAKSAEWEREAALGLIAFAVLERERDEARQIAKKLNEGFSNRASRDAIASWPEREG